MTRYYEGHWGELEKILFEQNTSVSLPPKWPQDIIEGQQVVKWQDGLYEPSDWTETGVKEKKHDAGNASNDTQNTQQNKCIVQ